MWEKEEMNCVDETTTTCEKNVPTISSKTFICVVVYFSVYVFDIDAAMYKARRFIPLEKEVLV